MATDISKVGNGYSIGNKLYVEPPDFFEFYNGRDGKVLEIKYPPSSKLETIAIPFSDLTVASLTPASTTAAITTLSSIFPQSGASGGGSSTSEITMTDADGVVWTQGVSTAGTTTWTKP